MGPEAAGSRDTLPTALVPAAHSTLAVIQLVLWGNLDPLHIYLHSLSLNHIVMCWTLDVFSTWKQPLSKYLTVSSEHSYECHSVASIIRQTSGQLAVHDQPV